MKNYYILLIDTNSYAGNFERDLTAHCTGHIGECRVGEEFVDQDIKKQFYNIFKKPDEYSCCRPTEIFPGKDGTYSTVGIFFQDEPTLEQLKLIKQRTKTFNDRLNTDIQFLGFRLEKIETTSSITILNIED